MTRRSPRETRAVPLELPAPDTPQRQRLLEIATGAPKRKPEDPKPQPPAPISQYDLEGYIKLHNELIAHQREIDKLSRGLIDRVLTGAATEPGIHDAELLAEIKGEALTLRLVVR